MFFTKIETKLQAVVTKELIHAYEKQYAWVRWGSLKSSEFRILNGTWQGPALFTVYVQKLLDRLQRLWAGCHVGATFHGAVAWADDFLLTAPSSGSMQQMLDVAMSYAAELGLQFSTNPDPVKSKSKAVFMVG